VQGAAVAGTPQLRGPPLTGGFPPSLAEAPPSSLAVAASTAPARSPHSATPPYTLQLCEAEQVLTVPKPVPSALQEAMPLPEHRDSPVKQTANLHTPEPSQ
jgi:hypothetical protein